MEIIQKRLKTIICLCIKPIIEINELTGLFTHSLGTDVIETVQESTQFLLLFDRVSQIHRLITPCFRIE